MKFFGMGGLELVIILVVILLIFGPKNLPKLGNAFGKTVSNLRAGMNEGKKKKQDEDAAEAADAAEKADAAASSEEPAIVPELEGEVTMTAEDIVEEAENIVSEATEDAAAAMAGEPQKRVVKKVVKKKA